MSLLRDGLLDGRTVLLAGEPPALGLADRLGALGAGVTAFAPELDEAGEGGAAWVAERAPVHALVFDGAGAFGSGGADGLAAMLDAAWVATAAVAAGDLIPRGDGGRIVLLAPAAGAGALAQAARAGLENLARTLSIEWARYGITTVAVARGAVTGEESMAEFVAFLLSVAGGYYSGCRFDLA